MTIRLALLGLLACGTVLAPRVWSAETSGVSSQSISLPSGPGSIEGLGESFEPQLNTGTASFAVSFAVPPGRLEVQPAVGLAYNGGSSNGFVGIGWAITGQDFIQRQTDKGLPAYDPSDIFVTAAGEELVPLDDGSFRAENEGGFKRYSFDGASNAWRAELPDGGELVFGEVVSARIEDANRTYRWMLTRREDARGNRVEYQYTSFAGSTNQVYPSRIYYTRHAAQSLDGEQIVVFSYAEDRPDPISDFRPSYELTTTHRLVRVDMCTRGGSFTPMSVCDDVGEVGAARVRSYRLRYDEVGSCSSLSCSRGLVGAYCTSDTQCVAGATRLAGVEEVGADNATALPELTFTYTDYDFSTTATWSGIFGFPATELGGSEAALADIDADGLPDVVQTPSLQPGVYKRWMNRGIGFGGAVQFADVESFTGPTSQRIGNPGTQLIDLDGDGVADLLTRPDPTGDMFELFRGTGKGYFELTAEPFQILGVDGFTNSAEGFGDSAVRFVDVDFDKRIDVVRTVALGSSADDLLVRQTGDFGGGRGMLPSRSCGAVPDALFQGGKTFLEDLNGDRLLDIVVVEIAGGGDEVEEIRYFPNVGTGGFGRLGTCGQQGLPIVVGGDPVSGLPGADFNSFRRFFWHDLTNDGLGDLVYLGPSSVSVWVNRGGSGLYRVDLGVYPGNVELTLCEPGPGCNPDTVQFTDMNGNSTTDVLFADRESGSVLYLDLAGAAGVPAHLLETIDNGLGRVTTIGYEPSTRDYLDAAAAGQSWKSRLPFPVTVVATRSVRFGLDLDGVPGEDDYFTDFRYRDGFYDGVEKEFRGFSEVEAIRRGDASQPSLVTRYSFHTGAPDGVDNDADGSTDERTVRGGAEEEPLKGVTLEVRTETCSNGPDGDCGVTGEVFTHEFSRWDVKTLHGAMGKACSGDPIVTCCIDSDCSAHGLGTCEQQMAAETGSRPELACEAGKSVRWAVTTAQRSSFLERGSGPRVDIMMESLYDDFGNATASRQWGIVEAPELPYFGCLLTSGVCSNDSFVECGSDVDCGIGSCLKASHADGAACDDADAFAFTNAAGITDERFESTQYVLNQNAWQLRCVSEAWVEDADNNEVSRARSYYDGLSHGECVEGLRTRTEGWLEEEGRWVVQTDSLYDGFGNTLEETDALGNRRSFGLDANFATFPASETIHLESHTLSLTAGHHEGFGRMTHMTDWAVTGSGARSDIYYDALGRPITRVLPGDTEQFPTSEYSYHLNPGNDGLSWIDVRSRETVGGGTVDARSYVDAMGRALATVSEGDDGGWVVTGLQGFGLAGTQRAAWVAFFTENLEFPALDPGLPHESIEYDEAGRELSRTLPGGAVRARVYRPLSIDQFDENDMAGLTPGAHVTLSRDGLDRLVEVIERDGGVPQTTQYAYDTVGNWVETTDALGNETRVVYDSLSRRLRYEGPDRGSLVFVYDDSDRVVETRDARGAGVLRSHDAAGRVLTEFELLPGESPGSPAVRYHYDLPAPGPVEWGDGRSGEQMGVAGRISWIEDAPGAEYHSYDERGRVVWQTRVLQSLGSGATGAYTLHHAYDTMNRMTQLEYPDGDRLVFRYGPRGLLQEVAGANGGQSLVDSLVYRPNGTLAELVLGSGTREIVTYDDRQRRVGLQVRDPGDVPLVHREIVYDPSSNPLALLDLRPGVAPGTARHDTRRMDYDDLHRLTRFRVGSHSDPGFEAGRVEFTYDAIGNRLSRSSTIVGDPDFSGGTPQAYAYGGAAGRSGRGPRQASDPPGPHALSSVEGAPLGYDENGNVTSYGGVQATWDAVDRLAGLTSASIESQYAYDHGGRRVAKRVHWLAGTGERRAGEHSETLYPHPEFEVRDGEPVKSAFLGDRRLAEVTGTLDPTAIRAQRLTVRPGWNNATVAVTAPDAAAQLGIGDGPGERPAWVWDAVQREYQPATSSTPLPPGSVLWIDAAQPEVLTIRGTYDPPDAVAVRASGGHVANAWLGALPISEQLTDATFFGFDAGTQSWKVGAVSGDLLIDELPKRLPPGTAWFAAQHVATSTLAPPDSVRTRYFHLDAVGSISAVTDGAGALVEETAYLPFGGVRLRTKGDDAGLARSPYAFTSKERDEESGLTQVEARYLDNTRGRFLSVDAALFDLGPTPEPRRANAYAYGLNNPFRFNDTDGRNAVAVLNRMVNDSVAQVAHAPVSAIRKVQGALQQRRQVRATALANKLYSPRQQARIKRAEAWADQSRQKLLAAKTLHAGARVAVGLARENADMKRELWQDAKRQAQQVLSEWSSVEDAKEKGALGAADKLFHDKREAEFRTLAGRSNALKREADAAQATYEVLGAELPAFERNEQLAQDRVNQADLAVLGARAEPLLFRSSESSAPSASTGASSGGDTK